MKRLRLFYLLCIVSVTWLSCKKAYHFIDTGALQTGKYNYPASTNALTDLKDGKALDGHYYSAGDTVAFELQFISQDAVSHISLAVLRPGQHADTTSSIPFNDNLYSVQKETDTAILQYVLPADVKAGQRIALHAVVTTINNLNTVRIATINTR